MRNEFLDRIISERDYKISLLRENLDAGDLDQDSLFQQLNAIATLQYRLFGHSDIITLVAKSTIYEKQKFVTQSFLVLEKSISFVDGIVAALASDSMNRHLFNSYYGIKNEASVRDKIIENGQNEILASYNLQIPDF
ncbi:MAG TPA: hypothetical protein V6D19_08035 [Stenomitos sp.]